MLSVTCYLRMHEIAVAVHVADEPTDWDEAVRRWRAAEGVGGRDRADPEPPRPAAPDAASFRDALLPWVYTTLTPEWPTR